MPGFTPGLSEFTARLLQGHEVAQDHEGLWQKQKQKKPDMGLSLCSHIPGCLHSAAFLTLSEPLLPYLTNESDDDGLAELLSKWYRAHLVPGKYQTL